LSILYGLLVQNCSKYAQADAQSS